LKIRKQERTISITFICTKERSCEFEIKEGEGARASIVLRITDNNKHTMFCVKTPV